MKEVMIDRDTQWLNLELLSLQPLQSPICERVTKNADVFHVKYKLVERNGLQCVILFASLVGQSSRKLT